MRAAQARRWASPEGREAQPAQTKKPAPAQVPTALLLRASSQEKKKRGKSEGQKETVQSFCSSRHLGGSVSLSEAFKSLGADSWTPWPPTPPGGPLERELGFCAGTPERRAPSAARGAASEPEWAGARRARAVRRPGAGERPGHVWQRRGGFGARGFKKPGPALPRAKETLGAAVSRGTSRRGSAPAPALPRPPPSRILSKRLLGPGASKTE
ncbi:unnamed protein product [Rangifer tarandus platyrhynchus]|uniref:Uncharacterized protein n=1 Tax=Rangifer tarandus platyrhynchus TaxID=3082113 RepID=A0AC59YQK1_RANTA